MKPPVRINLKDVTARETRDESDEYKHMWYVQSFEDYYYGDPEDREDFLWEAELMW